MKFEPAKLSKLIDQNYSYLMPDFYEMQIEYMQSMNNIYKDLDAALVAMFLVNKYYQSDIKENHLSNNISNKIFYKQKISLRINKSSNGLRCTSNSNLDLTYSLVKKLLYSI